MQFGKAAGALALAAFALATPIGCPAAQGSSQFRINVDLQSAPPRPASGSPQSPSAFCRTTSLPGAFGATLTIVCSTGVVVDIAPSRPGAPLAPMHGGAYRYLTQVSVGGQILGTVDLYSGLGTTTSWRVVNLVDRQYVEMTLNW